MPTNSDPALILNKITIPQGITTFNKASTFPTHYSDWGFGGLRTVNVSIAVTSVTDRDAIPAAQRYVGLTVVDTVSVTKTYYRLEGGTENSNWVSYNTQTEPFIGTTKNDIPDLRRIEGMLVYIIDEDAYYRLEDGITNTDWTEFSSGAGGGAGLRKIVVTTSSWVGTPAGDPTMLTATLTHSLDTIDIDAVWYQTGTDGSVFVPWEVDLTDPKNKIVGCIPLGSAFAGFVLITSSVTDVVVPIDGFTLAFDITAWETPMGSDTSFLNVVHGLNTMTPATEVYDNNGDEQLLCVTRPGDERIRLTVYTADVFSGYVHVRG